MRQCTHDAINIAINGVTSTSIGTNNRRVCANNAPTKRGSYLVKRAPIALRNGNTDAVLACTISAPPRALWVNKIIYCSQFLRLHALASSRTACLPALFYAVLSNEDTKKEQDRMRRADKLERFVHKKVICFNRRKCVLFIINSSVN